MAETYLQLRLNALRRSQNADGGWGYFPNKQSWLEPTIYAAMALHGEPAADRAWALLRRWQQPDGSLRPAAEVNIASWGTSLFITVSAARGEYGPALRRATEWLLGISGQESNWKNRMAARMGLLDAERDLNLKGWPWKPDTSSWVEPTSHAVIALKKASKQVDDVLLHERIRLGQAQLLDVRCADGGWNYGSRAVLRLDLPSYPETTGLALMGLQGLAGLGGSLDLAAKMLGDTVSPMGRAWLTMALRAHGAAVPQPSSQALPPDLNVVALEALASADGNHALLRTEAS